MSRLPLSFPPGMVRNAVKSGTNVRGTKSFARGRWYDGNLVRWYEGALLPIGGWALIPDSLVENTPQGDLSYAAIGEWAWRGPGNAAEVAFGTRHKLWLADFGLAGTLRLIDIGAADYNLGAGNHWTFDNFGTDLIATRGGQVDNYGYVMRYVTPTDPTDGTKIANIAGAPSAIAVVVTPERFVVALGAGGDRKAVAWSDQEDPTTWTPAAENQAGDFVLATSGTLKAGRRGRGETLLWTSEDLWAMRYIGGTLVYSFQQLGSSCGAISPRSMAVVDGKSIWMGRRGFFIYDGYVRPLACEVGDLLFNETGGISEASINTADGYETVHCQVRAQFHEVTWYYKSNVYTSGAYEVRYVTYNWKTDHWALGAVNRSAGVDAVVTSNPVAVDGAGKLWQHEDSNNEYPVTGGSALVPYAESGPIQLDAADRVMVIRGYVPDESTLTSVGDTAMKLLAAMSSTGAETTVGPYSVTQPTDFRLTARQVRLRIDQGASASNKKWRFGTPCLEVVPGGLR